MEVSRLLLYVVSIALSLLLAGRLLSGKHTLGRLFGIVWLAWAMNSAILGIMLLIAILGGEYPGWSSEAWTLNALLQAVTPLIVCLWFARSNHGDG